MGTNATGRSDGKLPNKIGRIEGSFAPRLVEMLESPAYRVLSRAAYRILSRLEIEFSHHGGKGNGHLVCTHDDLEKYGVHRNSIGPAIRELEALGFIEVTVRGRGGHGEFRIPSQYRLTFRPTDDEEATHEWRRIKTVEQAAEFAAAARDDIPKKRKIGRGKRTDFGLGKRPEKPSAPVVDSANPDPVQSPRVLSISRGRGKGLKAGKARSCKEPLTLCRPSEQFDCEGPRMRTTCRLKRPKTSICCAGERSGEDHRVRMDGPQSCNFSHRRRFERSTKSSLVLIGEQRISGPSRGGSAGSVLHNNETHAFSWENEQYAKNGRGCSYPSQLDREYVPARSADQSGQSPALHASKTKAVAASVTGPRTELGESKLEAAKENLDPICDDRHDDAPPQTHRQLRFDL